MLADAYLAWIRSRIKSKPHLSQAGLARAMGVDRAMATQLFHGRRRIKLDEIEVIEAYLGERWLTQHKSPRGGGGRGDGAGSGASPTGRGL